jgi:hypothetical protein
MTIWHLGMVFKQGGRLLPNYLGSFYINYIIFKNVELYISYYMHFLKLKLKNLRRKIENLLEI